jgi:hypothetical protein
MGATDAAREPVAARLQKWPGRCEDPGQFSRVANPHGETCHEDNPEHCRAVPEAIIRELSDNRHVDVQRQQTGQTGTVTVKRSELEWFVTYQQW